jgi:hypothetical protein
LRLAFASLRLRLALAHASKGTSIMISPSLPLSIFIYFPLLGTLKEALIAIMGKNQAKINTVRS